MDLMFAGPLPRIRRAPRRRGQNPQIRVGGDVRLQRQPPESAVARAPSHR